MRAPARHAARSCALRPALSKITTCGRMLATFCSTSGVCKVGDDGNRVAGKGTLPAYGAWLLIRNCISAEGQRAAAALAMATLRAYSPIPYAPDTGMNNSFGLSGKRADPPVQYQKIPGSAEIGGYGA